MVVQQTPIYNTIRLNLLLMKVIVQQLIYLLLSSYMVLIAGISHSSTPKNLNIKTVAGICKLIDGCSLALCSAKVSVISGGICHRNKVNSMAWLYRDGLAMR